MSSRHLTLTALAAAVFAVAACSTSIPQAESVESLAAAFRAAGLEVSGPVAPSRVEARLFQAPSVLLRASGEPVLAFQFDSPLAAEEASRLVSADGYGVGNIYIQWSYEPHYFARGPLLVIYDGKQDLITRTLSQAMGQPFVGGLSTAES